MTRSVDGYSVSEARSSLSYVLFSLGTRWITSGSHQVLLLFHNFHGILTGRKNVACFLVSPRKRCFTLLSTIQFGYPMENEGVSPCVVARPQLLRNPDREKKSGRFPGFSTKAVLQLQQGSLHLGHVSPPALMGERTLVPFDARPSLEIPAKRLRRRKFLNRCRLIGRRMELPALIAKSTAPT